MRDRVSRPNMTDWQERTRSFAAIGGFIRGVGGMVMSGKDGIAETVPRQWVTAGIFDALGVRPIAGRTFLPSDDQQRANVVVLSEGFWRTRFDGDPSIVGSSIRLDGAPYTVVGVVPDEAQLIGRTSIWAMAARRCAVGAHGVLSRVRAYEPSDTRSCRAELAAAGLKPTRDYPSAQDSA